MTSNFANVFKYLLFGLGILSVIISCEKDFTNTGTDIVDNSIFTTEKHVSEVIAYSKNIEQNQTNNQNIYLLGVYQNATFGKLEASMVSQLFLQSPNPDYGVNPTIEDVVLDIPYYATLEGKQDVLDPENPGETIQVPDYVLDSIWSSGNINFNLTIHRLATYLNKVEIDDPTKVKKYYSDDTFDMLDIMYSDLVSPDKNDTLLLVERFRYPEGSTDGELYQTDTIKADAANPSLKIHFDKAYIKSVFLENSSGTDFANNANFQHFFKGFWFEAIANGMDNSALMALKFAEAKMTIYFSESEIKNEGENEDLNGNGVNGEQQVLVGTPRAFHFPLNAGNSYPSSGVKVNLYHREYSGAVVENYITNPNLYFGEETVFAHGATGSDIVLKLFGEDTNNNAIPDELEMIRQKNWLVNDARLSLYVDTDITVESLPNRLYLYYFGKDDEKLQTIDAMNRNGEGIGVLEKDDEGNPVKYTFHIPNHITSIISPDSEFSYYNLGIKVFDQYDNVIISEIDTIVDTYSANHQGVAIKGNLPLTEENRIKLEIFYSEKN